MDNSLIRHLAIKTSLSTWGVNYQTAIAGSTTPPQAADMAMLALIDTGIRTTTLEEAEMVVEMLLTLVDTFSNEWGDVLRGKLNETEAFFKGLTKGSEDVEG